MLTAVPHKWFGRTNDRDSKDLAFYPPRDTVASPKSVLRERTEVHYISRSIV
jgi:hypothetical protein